MVCPSAVQAALVVDALEVVKVGDEHVVALVHRHDGADGGTGHGIATGHADLVASVCTLGCVGVIADVAPGSVGFTHRLKSLMVGYRI